MEIDFERRFTSNGVRLGWPAAASAQRSCRCRGRSVPIIGTSRAICVAFNGEKEARAFLDHHAGGGVLQLPPPDNITINFAALDAAEWGKQAEARELQAATESDGLIAIRTRGAINTDAQIEHFAPPPREALRQCRLHLLLPG